MAVATSVSVRRARLQAVIAAQTAAAATSADSLTVAAVEGWNVRQPKDGRVWSVVRVATRNGIEGWGEARPLARDRFLQLRQALMGQPVHAIESLRAQLDAARGWAAADSALLDIAAKAANVPVYQYLGGPTRFKVRAYTALGGTNTDELLVGLERARKAGFRAASIPVPVPPFRNSGKAFVNAAVERFEAVRKAAGDGFDLILTAGSRLTAGDAQTIAASLERHYPLWFDEPCNTTSLGPVVKVASESVMPLGFGYQATDAAYFQNLLRENAIDLVRPELSTFGVSGVRRIATLAEVYYVAVSPRHGEGPVGTASALHLAAAIPNFFIQHIPHPPDPVDREMRAALTGAETETVVDGFVPLQNQPGLGVAMRMQALLQYGEAIA